MNNRGPIVVKEEGVGFCEGRQQTKMKRKFTEPEAGNRGSDRQKECYTEIVK